MSHSLARLDPFGHLTARTLVQVWLEALVAVHVICAIVAGLIGRWQSLTILAAMIAGLVAASLTSHPASKISLLGAWIGWWTHRFARWPSLDLSGVVVMMLISAYVIGRVAWAWRREGVESLRVGFRHPLSPVASWPELADLTRAERRLVLARARARLPRPKIFARQKIAVLACVLAVSVLWIIVSPAPGHAGSGVALPPGSGTLLLVALSLPLDDPLSSAAQLRRVLRDEVLPGFRQQPWLWDPARRAAPNSRGA